MANEHPPPWAWDGTPDRQRLATTKLLDANGAEVMGVYVGPLARIEFANQGVRELLRAAPEMLALLRDRVRWYGGEPDASWLIERNALLERLAAAGA